MINNKEQAHSNNKLVNSSIKKITVHVLLLGILTYHKNDDCSYKPSTFSALLKREIPLYYFIKSGPGALDHCAENRESVSIRERTVGSLERCDDSTSQVCLNRNTH